jgi:hypothetical protein
MNNDSIKLDERSKYVVIDSKNNSYFLIVAVFMFLNWKYTFVILFLLFLFLEG